MPRSGLPFFVWLGYVAFVIYGSLVPLQFQARPLADAWVVFQNIPFLELDIASRADWISNGVLYVPVAFLSAYLLTQTFRATSRLLLLALAGAFSAALAGALEFAQIFFPPRTVSFNDVMAECIGSFLGLVLSARYATWFQTLIKSFSNDPRQSRMRLLEAYAVAYLAFAFFPYDILLSWVELEAKSGSNTWGWFIAGNSPRIMLLGLQSVAEVVLTAPLGILLVRVIGANVANYRQAALIGIVLGSLIEFGQFFVYSGISQGLSILTRALGVCCGVALCKHRESWNWDRAAFELRRFTIPAGAIYLVTLVAINGWFVSSWHGIDFAAEQLAQVNFVPFYYHYFTSEAKALFSLLAVGISYLPIALLAWAHRRSSGFAALVSLFAATSIEASKLFQQPAHPDPGNVLLAVVVSWMAVRIMSQLALEVSAPIAIDAPVRAQAHGQLPAGGFPVWLILCLVGMGYWVLAFPAFPAPVGLLLLACTAIVWHRPVWVFAIIPAALPALDLAPWSGRFFFDEFDALLLVGLAAAYTRAPAPPRPRLHVDAMFAVAFAIVATSIAVSGARGMLPFQAPDANSFNNYYSPYNALRIAKGAVWAFLMYRLSRRFLATGVDPRRPFCWGMVVGLALTVAIILWERVAFSGLWNFNEGYRVTGPFSAMHIGGAYIECFLAVATPFLVVLTLEKRHWILRLAGIGLLLATTYALMVTFSRNGYAAFAVAIALVLLAALLKSKRLVRSGVVITGLVAAMLMVAVPIFEGEFARSRMATVGADLVARQAHWQDALDIRDRGLATSLFGMGLGRFPEISYWRSAINPRSATYRLESEAGNSFLRLASGDSLYLEQLVSIEPGQKYVLKLDVRPSRPNDTVTVPICEKWLLSSYNCIWQATSLGKDFGTWRSIKVPLNTNGFAISPWYSRRPIKLSLSYATANSTIDIDNVGLETEFGAKRLSNGDFSDRLDHWFFATDGHLQWHVKSLFYGVLFDQGWFGLLSLCVLLVLALGRATMHTYRGDGIAGALLAALSGFLVVGIFDTLIDAPRFLLLLLLLVMFSAAGPASGTRRMRSP